MVHVDFNLAHPQHIKLLKTNKKQGYEFKIKCHYFINTLCDFDIFYVSFMLFFCLHN
jgi:hypothetical protein